MSILKYKNSSGVWTNIEAIKGDPGVTPSISLLVNMIASGSAPTVTQSGSPEYPIITLGIPMSGISPSGSRGQLAGYETVGNATTINATSPDANEVSSAVTISNGTAGTAWTKLVRVTAAVKVTIGSNWKWSSGVAPTTIVAGSILTCTWCGSGGIVSLLSPS